jgi:hypothetical protein
MAYQDFQQQMPLQNPQHWGMFNYGQPQGGQGTQGAGNWPGLAAYSQFGQPNVGGWNQGGWGGHTSWGQRHLSQQDVGEVVRQLLPLLPVVLAQAQQQPMAAFGYGGYNQGPRMLTPQDVNEVVRQILPIIPQIVGLLQSGGQWSHQGYAGQGGYGGSGQIGQPFHGQPFQPQFASAQFPFGQAGMPPYQAAFGGGQGWGQPQRHLTQQDIGEVVRQLTAAIPQVINNLQTFNQQRAI